VYGQAGTSGIGLLTIIVIASVVCSFALGKFAPPGSSFTRESAGIVISAAVLFSIWFAAIAPEYEKKATEIFSARMQAQKTEDGWFNYNPALIKDFAKMKRTVFIDVTADWCLTCKANEAAVLDDDDFRHAMDSLNVALVKADWTRETPEVNALLKSLKKSGVPAYVIYPEGDVSRQIVLSEILTTDDIVEQITNKF